MWFGGGREKKKKKIVTRMKQIRPTHPHKKNVFALIEKKKSTQQATVGFGFCKYFFFCYIRYDTSGRSIDCSVPFFL